MAASRCAPPQIGDVKVVKGQVVSTQKPAGAAPASPFGKGPGAAGADGESSDRRWQFFPCHGAGRCQTSRIADAAARRVVFIGGALPAGAASPDLDQQNKELAVLMFADMAPGPFKVSATWC